MGLLRDSITGVSGVDKHTCDNANDWIGIKFQASASYNAATAEILIYRSGSPGTITFHIQGIAAGAPDGVDIITETFDGDALTADTSGEWKSITISPIAALTSGTSYALLIEGNSCDASNKVMWINSGGQDNDANAWGLSSSNNGSSYIQTGSYEPLFKLYDDFTPPVGGPTKKRLIAVAGSALWYEDI